MKRMDSPAFDLWYDATSVGADLVVETWISHGPRASDASFDPRPGGWVLLGDDDEAPQRARVIRRDGNRIWAQIALAAMSAPATSATASR